MWNFAKSAEAMFSRWAVKKVCKFVLKKKLGQFILGDIDVDQLDVQFAEGTIQLSDLALDVDFLNHKIGAATSMMIKEGSIGSLLVRMPWKGKGCEIEMDELELVVTPRTENSTPSKSGSSNIDQDSSVPGKLDADMMDNIAKPTSKDVHEGVKTIAKMVKWLLTSFHVRINRLIVVFDPCLEKNENTSGCCSSLVLRISEIECGTGVSEDVNQNAEARSENFLGISQLTTYVKFQEALLELLQMDDVDSHKCIPCLSESTYGKLFSVGHPPGVTIPIMTGERGGFSGSLKLSIPWKNGSLDIRKVDADAFVEPVQLTFQPSTIKWLLISWEACKSIEKEQSTHIPTDSVFLDSASHFSSPLSAYSATDKVTPACGNVPTEYASLTLHESATDALLPGSRIISDWVPFFMNKHKTNGIEELDFGASVDQFFECFDGMRSSQFGSSGMWNWTSSVVSAITAVSSLASGSLHVASEQQPVETNLRATLAGISVVLPFQDENQNHLCETKGGIGSCSDVFYLCVGCRDILLVMQVSSREMRVEGTMGCVEVANYSSYKDDTMGLDVQGCKKYVNRRTSSIQRLQADVHSAIPLHAFSSKYYSAVSSGVAAEGFPCGDRDDLVKVSVLKTSGVTYCQCTVSSTSSDRSLTRPTSFSLKLPHFVAWVDFPLLSRLLELLKDFGRAVEVHNQPKFPSEASKKKSGSSDKVLKRASSDVTTLFSTDNVRGDIIIPNARIIVCFRSNGAEKVKGLSSWDQFIALEFSSPSTNNKGISQDHGQTSDASSEKRYSSTATRSLQLNVGNLDVFLVRPASKHDVEIRSGNMQRLKLAAVKVLSITNSKGSHSIINMLWQEGFVTGPWIAKKAKSLATFEESRSISKFVGKDHEFASVSTVKDLKDLSSQTRQEIILSSAFSFHVCLPAVAIKLDNPQNKELCCLLDQMMNDISGLACDSVNVKEESTISQTSILVNCESFEVCISLDVKETVKSSMHCELPGSWQHLRLKVQKLEVLSVSNIGGISGATFFWLAHGEGKLWGSMTDICDQEFLLITCSNSTMKRGDGGGSNVLSSMLAGSDIVHLWEPTSYNGSTSVTVRCATIVAVGGRLDWLDAICSFFIFSPEIEQAVDKCKEEEDLNPPHGSSFVLNLVDIGLSYEPYLKTMVVSGEDSESSYFFVKETREEYVSCLLAASSLNLSTSTEEDSKEVDYKIRIQDLGLLLCVMSKPEDVGGTYSVEHLHKNGYVKVARETHIEAILRTNCKNGLLWELECSKSHIFVETCHDTMSSLIRLAGQIQQLFAPDMEESVVHLQTRWNKVQQEQERRGVVEETQIFDCESSPLAAQFHMSGVVTEPPLVGLMDEISEDAFQGKNPIFQYNSSDSHSDISFDQDLGEAAYTRIGTPDTCLSGPSYDGSVPMVEAESSQTFLQEGNVVQLIEEYCLSELRPLSELSIGRQSSHKISKCKSTNVRNGDGSRESSGWYGTSARILENHIPEMSERSKEQIVNDKLPSTGSNKCNDVGKAIGRVLLKNIDVRWRMVGGSHWDDSWVTGHHSLDFSGRDDTLCLELSLCGMEFQYDVFPVGGVCVSKLSLLVKDFYLYDRSKDAPWKMVLGYYHSKDHPRTSSSKGFKLDLEAVRPDPLTPLEEYRLQVAFLPMLLHLHQCQLDFLISFFGEKSSTVDQSSGSYQDTDGSKALPTKSNNHARNEIAEEAFLPYFQKFDIWPMLVRIDYSPSRVDLAALRGGKYVELVNLVPWKGVELQLKHVHAVGVYGWGSVCETIIGEWLEDISQNQIHKILHGLPTIRSLVAVGSGAAKLVSLPVEHYRKDKRVLKGMQRGTIAFLRSISLEAVGLGVHLAAGTHDILLQAEYLLTSIPSSVPWWTPHRVKSSTRSNQPKDAQQGMRQAYESLSDGLGKSAAALVRTPLKKYERGAGAGSTFASAVRGVPAAAIAPASACASAVHCALLGFRNSLDRERKKESIEKYLGPPQPWEN